MELLTAKEVAERLRVTPECIYGWFDRGCIQGFRAGRHLRIYAESVDTFIEERSNKKRPKAESKPVPRPLPKKPAVTPNSGFRCLLS